jgi:hypothetical protein
VVLYEGSARFRRWGLIGENSLYGHDLERDLRTLELFSHFFLHPWCRTASLTNNSGQGQIPSKSSSLLLLISQSSKCSLADICLSSLSMFSYVSLTLHEAFPLLKGCWSYWLRNHANDLILTWSHLQDLISKWDQLQYIFLWTLLFMDTTHRSYKKGVKCRTWNS